MSKKFNPKVFQGDRIYRAISGNQGINKLWIWDSTTSEYQPPQRGNAYLAKKRISINGNVQRHTQTFETLAAAQGWMKDVSLLNQLHITEKIKPGLKFNCRRSRKRVKKRWISMKAPKV